MAEGFGESDKLKNWKNSPNTQRYIKALENTMKDKLGKIYLVKSEEGKYGGTWIHEKLILNFARYLNDVLNKIFCE